MILSQCGYLKKCLVVVLFASLGGVHAGSYEDFFNAIENDESVQVTRLLVKGFDANTVDPNGQTGLHLALRDLASKSVLILIEWPKTDVNRLNSQGESALMLAALKGLADPAAKLIARDADVNKTGWTPLHYAASGGHTDLISLLLEKNAYIDAESPNGSTPLMMAAMYGTAASVRILLEQGADPNLKNQQGLTALAFAQQANRPDAIGALTEKLKTLGSKGKW